MLPAMAELPTRLGRRERNKAEKRDRIVGAATTLFTERGYDNTTTQQVSEKADVAEGTLFRYAATKSELLLMVVNAKLRPVVEEAPDTDPTLPVDEAVLRAFDPLVQILDLQPNNAAPFLREIYFGDDGDHRRETIDLFQELEHKVAAIIAPHHEAFPDGLTLQEASEWVFFALISAVLDQVIDNPTTTDRNDALRKRVRVLLRGLNVL